MTEPPGVIVLLVSAFPADREDSNALLYHNSAIAFARIVCSRGRQLFVKADPASLFAIITACAESPSAQARLSLAGEGFSKVIFTKDGSRYRAADFEEESRDDVDRSSWSVLMNRAGGERLDEWTFNNYVRETHRKLVVALGSPTYVVSAIQTLHLLESPGNTLFVEDLTLVPRVAIETWDVPSALGGGAYAEPPAEREQSDELSAVRQAAVREARLRVAMELAVDRFLGEPD